MAASTPFDQAVDAVLDGDLPTLRALLDANPELVRARSATTHRATLLHYVAAIVRATRPDESAIEGVRNYLRWGAGPRAGQALVLCAKAHAVMRGRFAVTLEDLGAIAPAALRHRLLLNFQAEADGVSTDDIVAQVFDGVAEPASRLD